MTSQTIKMTKTEKTVKMVRTVKMAKTVKTVKTVKTEKTAGLMVNIMTEKPKYSIHLITNTVEYCGNMDINKNIVDQILEIMNYY